MINQDLKYYGHVDGGTRVLRAVIIAGVSLGFLGLAIIATVHMYDARPRQLDCSACHNPQFQKQSNMAEYFKKKGSKTPEEMAYAVLKTRSPRLLAAMATVESKGTPSIRRTGYRKSHDGAFQVNPKHWGEVSTDPIKQALQAEAILEELVKETGNIKSALNQYGGDKTRKVYARNILTELVEVPR